MTYTKFRYGLASPEFWIHECIAWYAFADYPVPSVDNCAWTGSEDHWGMWCAGNEL